MVKLSGLAFKEVMLGTDNADARAELLLLSPSMLVPCLSHGKVKVWDTLAIGEYLNEIAPKAQLLPTNVVHRAHCRAICGEMHSGFAAMRASLPMNIKARIQSFKVWSKAQLDIDRVVAIWQECLATYKGPYLFGKNPALQMRCLPLLCCGLRPTELRSTNLVSRIASISCYAGDEAMDCRRNGRAR